MPVLHLAVKVAAPVAVCTLVLAACGGGDDDGAGDARTGGAAARWFEDVTEARGLTFAHTAHFSGEYAMSEITGSGLAVFDADGDGRLDLYFVDSGNRPGDGAPNALFRQLEDGTFADVTATSGLGDAGYGMGVAAGDIDNDGDLDVYVGNHGRDALYENGGAGVFEDVTESAGISGELWSTSVAMLDFDDDGFLDIWVAHYLWEDPSKKCVIKGRRDYCGPHLFEAQPDTLYHNRGDGTFENVSENAGISRVFGHGLGLIPEDFDEDGMVDVYVANDNDANNLWINRGGGRFSDGAMMSGTALSGMGESEASMGLAVGDVDGDGRYDLFSTHFDGQTNTLYLSAGKAVWRDATSRMGLAAPSLEMTGFGTEFGDLDNDGDLDIVVVNGRVARGDVRGEVSFATYQRDYGEPNQVFENLGDRFAEVAGASGGLGELREISRGLTLVDLDGDGGLDVILSNNNGRARIHRNVARDRGHWLLIRALDPTLNRVAYGARVIVRAGEREWPRTVTPSRSYLTSACTDVHVGLGEADVVDAIEVIWPGGVRETFSGGPADRVVVLERGADRK